jgi:hypothetical protein
MNTPSIWCKREWVPAAASRGKAANTPVGSPSQARAIPNRRSNTAVSNSGRPMTLE